MKQINIFQSNRYKIKEVIPQTGDNILLKVKTNMNPLPGQFVEVSIPGLGEAPISSASYNNKLLDLNIRKVGSVTNAVADLKKGAKLHLRGPYGTGYPMEKLKGKNLVLIGGGCGVAPLRGAIEYVDKSRLDYREINMFFGFRTPDDVLFQEEMKQWEKRYHLHMSVDEVPNDNPFNCPVGFVTQILQDAKLTTKNTEVLICGPPIMMNKSIEILETKGFADDQIWVSLERHMKCTTGKCGHCMIHGKYVCIDGPVFRYDEVKGVDE